MSSLHPTCSSLLDTIDLIRVLSPSPGEMKKVGSNVQFDTSHRLLCGREFADLDDLNAQADVWCRGLAADRACPNKIPSAFARPSPRKRIF